MLGVHTMTVMVWVFAVPRLLGDGAALPVGTFVSFLLYTTMFIAPIEVIGQMARTINRATTSAHRVFEVLDTEPEVRDVAAPVRLRSEEHTSELQSQSNLVCRLLLEKKKKKSE